LRKLENPQLLEKPQNPGRAFHKLGIAGLGLLAVLQTGCAATIRPAEPPKAETVMVGGRELTVKHLDKTLIDMVRETEGYPRGEYSRDQTPDGVYISGIKLPGDISIIATLGDLPKGNTLLLSYYDKTGKGKAVEKGKTLSLQNFVDYAAYVTGNRIERIGIVVEQGKIDHLGKKTDYTTAYLLPVDAEGRILGTKWNNKYVVYAMVYYADVFYGGPVMVITPDKKAEAKEYLRISARAARRLEKELGDHEAPVRALRDLRKKVVETNRANGFSDEEIKKIELELTRDAVECGYTPLEVETVFRDILPPQGKAPQQHKNK